MTTIWTLMERAGLRRGPHRPTPPRPGRAGGPPARRSARRGRLKGRPPAARAETLEARLALGQMVAAPVLGAGGLLAASARGGPGDPLSDPLFDSPTKTPRIADEAPERDDYLDPAADAGPLLPAGPEAPAARGPVGPGRPAGAEGETLDRSALPPAVGDLWAEPPAPTRPDAAPLDLGPAPEPGLTNRGGSSGGGGISGDGPGPAGADAGAGGGAGPAGGSRGGGGGGGGGSAPREGDAGTGDAAAPRTVSIEAVDAGGPGDAAGDAVTAGAGDGTDGTAAASDTPAPAAGPAAAELSSARVQLGGGRSVGLSTADGRLTNVTHAPARAGGPVALPHGTFGFHVEDVTVGGVAAVTLTLPDGGSASGYWKQDAAGALTPFAFDGETGATVDGDEVTLRLRDGGRGDADGLANGVIVDPGGPGITEVVRLGPAGADGLEDWRVVTEGGSAGGSGGVRYEGGDLLIEEGDSFHVGLERTVTVPDAPAVLRLEFEADFDAARPFVRDAFEVSLFAEDGSVLAAPFAAGRESYLNVTAGVGAAVGPWAAFGEGAGTGEEPPGGTVAGVVDLDLSRFGAGESVVVALRLVGTDDLEADGTPADGADGSVVRLLGPSGPPTAAPDAFAVAEDAVLDVPAAGGVLANDADPDGDTLTAELVTGPARGTLDLRPDGSFVYTPEADFYGADAFTYRASAGGEATDPVSVSLTVTPVNDPPAAAEDALVTPEDTPLTFDAADLTANDSAGPDNEAGQKLTVTAVTPTADTRGTVALNGDGTVTFTPEPDYHGPASFRYTVADDGATGGAADPLSADGVARVTVTEVNDPPAAADDSLTVAEDTPRTIAAAELLGNDSPGPANEAGQSLSVVEVEAAADTRGAVVLNPDGTVTYTPEANYNGPASFLYTVSDDGTTGGAADPLMSRAVARLTVMAENDPPTANDDAFTVAEDAPAGALDVLANDTIFPDAGETLRVLSVTATSAGGTAVVLPDGSGVRYTPAADWFGTETFTYTVGDGDPGRTDAATVTVTVTPVNDPPVAADDFAATDEDVPLTLSAADLLANDSPGPANEAGQTLSIVAVQATAATRGTVVRNDDGTVTYAPEADYHGPASFTYTVTDDGITAGAPDPRTATGTVRVTVSPVNDPPAPADDAFTVAEDAAPRTLDVLANDSTAPDAGETLTVTGVGAGSAGGSVEVLADGSGVRYAPAADFFGTETFSYTVNDGTPGGDATASVTVTVTEVNDPPAAADDIATTPAGTPLTIPAADLLTNDGAGPANESAQTLSVLSVAAGPDAHGTVTLNADGSVTFTPEAGYAGPAEFTYTVTDDGTTAGVPDPRTATATVRVDVTPTNAPPVAVGDTFATDLGKPLTVSAVGGLLRNDSDPDGDPIAAVLLDGPANGTASVNADGSFTYTPAAGFEGYDAFTYRARDDGGLWSAPATVRVQVGGGFWVPGDPGTLQVVTISLEEFNTEASYRNELGLFISGPGEAVGGLNPGDAGYAAAAITDPTRTVVVSRPADNSQVPNLPPFRITLAAGTWVSFYLIQDETTQAFLDRNPENVYDPGLPRGQKPLAFFTAHDANPDGYRHFEVGTEVEVGKAGNRVTLYADPGEVLYAIEDLTNGGDKDHDDLIFSVSATPETVIGPEKFFVADDRRDALFEYNPDGVWTGQPAFAAANGAARGATSSADGTTRWVADANGRVYRYDDPGLLTGDWAAAGLAPGAAEGVTTDETDVWVLDAAAGRVARYAGAAAWASDADAAPAAASFALHADNADPSGLATDGTALWVVDRGPADEVFVYDLAGTLTGRWLLDGENGNATGITNDPTGTSDDLWVVDRDRREVFRYAGATAFRGDSTGNGATAAADRFGLALPNTAPQGIADPMLIGPGGPGGPGNPGAPSGPPELTVDAADWDRTAPAGEPLLIFGEATRAGLPAEAVFVNGAAVAALDASGRFFTSVTPGDGPNDYFVTARHPPEDGVLTEEPELIGGRPPNLTVRGDVPDAGIDFGALTPAAAVGVTAEYGRTSLRTGSDLSSPPGTRVLAGAEIVNGGTFAVGGPLLVAVRGITAPGVSVVGADGSTPDGLPYFDLTELLAGGRLEPGDRLPPLTFEFENPHRERFSYELVLFGTLNRPPRVNSVPDVDADVGRPYEYAAFARDPDGDALSYELAAGPSWLSVDAATGTLSALPAVSDRGDHEVVLRVSDGRGGVDEQAFTLTVGDGVNTPPVFTSLPETAAYVHTAYAYDSDAADPEGDRLEYFLVDGPDGLTVEVDTGVVAWTPAGPDAGETFPVTLRAVEADTAERLEAVQTYDVRVFAQPGNNPPVIVSDPQTHFRVAGQAGATFGTVDPDVIDAALAAGETWDTTVSVTLDGLVASPTPYADIVVAVDESGSMSMGQAWITEMVEELEVRLGDLGVGVDGGRVNRYGIVGFGGSLSTPAPRSVFFGGAGDPRFFGSAAEFAGTFSRVTADGGEEDGLAAMDFALDYPYREGSTRVVLLVTDEPRTVLDEWLKPDDLVERAGEVGAALHVVGPAYFSVDTGAADGPEEAFGLDHDSLGYLADGTGGYLTYPGGVPGSPWHPAVPDHYWYSSLDDYYGPAWDTGGAGWSYEPIGRLQLSRPGQPGPTPMTRESFTAAFADVTAADVLRRSPTREVGLRFSRDDAPAGRLDAGTRLIPDGGGAASFDIRLTGDGGQDAFGVEFFDVATGRTVGRIPVGINTGYRYDVDALDPDGDTVTYRVLPESDVPAGAIDPVTGVIDWVPPGPGEWRVVVEAADGRGGTDVQEYVLKADPPGAGNTPPEIDSVAPGVVPAGTPYLYQVLASDGDGDGLIYLLDGGPAGMSVDARSGLISWNPTAADAGSTPHVGVVRVSDRRGGEATQTFEIRVTADAPNNSPEIIEADLPPAAVGVPWVHRAEAVDADGDALEWDLPVRPPGMTVDAATGVIAWTPRPEQGGREVEAVLRVRDGRGGFDLWVMRTAVSRSNHPPEFLRVPGPRDAADAAITVGPGRLFRDLVRVTDPDGDAVELTLDPATLPPADGPGSIPALRPVESPDGFVVPGYYWLEWTPAASHAGPPDPYGNATSAYHEFGLVAADGRDGGRATASVLFEVDPNAAANRSPRVAPPPTVRVRAGGLAGLQIEAVDPDGDPLTYSVAGGPDGLTIHPDLGLLRWETGAGDVGTHLVDVTVSDGISFPRTVRARFEVSADPPNGAPEITTVAPTVAVLEQVYAYDAAATDPDGDAVYWELTDAPDGMFVDGLDGRVRWLPVRPELLGTHEVTLRAFDALGASQTQTFAVTLRAANLPPQITSSPDTRVAAAGRYVYGVSAVDPEGGPIAFGGLTVLDPDGVPVADSPEWSESVDGLLVWPEAPTRLGVYTVTVRATDEYGAASIQTFPLEVFDPALADVGPVITSEPPLTATVGERYEYLVEARDADGDVPTFVLAESPPGAAGAVAMALTPVDDGDNYGGTASARLTWTPAAGHLDAGNPAVHYAEVRVTANGKTTWQRIGLLVRAENRAPTLDPISDAAITRGATFRYDVRAADPDGDPLTYELVTGPSGMTIDGFGRLALDTTPGTWPLTNTVRVRVTDVRGLSAEEIFVLTQGPDSSPPRVAVAHEPDRPLVGEEVSLRVEAVDDLGVESLTLRVRPQGGGDGDWVDVPLDAAGRGTWTPDASGPFEARAVAADAAGNEGEATAVVHVADGSAAPTVRLDAPAVVSAPVTVTGLVADDVAVTRWTLELLDARGRSLGLIAEGAGDVPDGGALGTLDPTARANGLYRLRLSAYDAGEAAVVPVVAERTVRFEGTLKLGNFTLGYTDLAVPVAGIPVTVGRSYDTLDAGTRGDFGYGWSLNVGHFDVSVEYPPGTRRGLGIDLPAFVEGTRVVLTDGNGIEQGFTFRPYLADRDMFGRETWKPHFVPDAGVTSRLLSADANMEIGRLNDSEYLVWTGGGLKAYNPLHWAFGGAFELYGQDGLRRVMNAETGDVASIEDRHGNVVSVRDDGLYSNRGRAVTFERDTFGRITRVTDPRGHFVSYEYDGDGNLAAVTDRRGNDPDDPTPGTTRYRYEGGDGNEHFITAVVDPLGNESVGATYEGGRVTALTDAAGGVVSLNYAVTPAAADGSGGGATVTVRDPLNQHDGGAASVVTLDARGNAVREKNAAGVTVLRTFDGEDRPTSETRVIGSEDGTSGENDDLVTRMTYDDRGLVETRTDELGNLTRYGYTASGQVAHVVDPLGNAAGYAYSNSADDPYDPRAGFTQGNLVFTADALGNATRFEYDRFGNVEAVATGPRNSSWTYWGSGSGGGGGGGYGGGNGYGGGDGGYGAGGGGGDGDPWGGANAVRTAFEYDPYGDLVATTDPRGVVREFATDAMGAQVGTTFVWTNPADAGDVRAVSTSVDLDAHGMARANVTPTGTTATEYDALDRPRRSVDARGLATEQTYDRRDLVTESRREARDADGSVVWLASRTVYDAAGRAEIGTDEFRLAADGVTPAEPVWGSRTLYDDAGRAVGSERLKNVSVTLTPDPGGATSAATLADVGTVVWATSTEYDDSGRVARTVDRDGTETLTDYDRFGRVWQTRTRTAGSDGLPLWRTGRTFYDGFGRAAVSVDPFLTDDAGAVVPGQAVTGSRTVYDGHGRAAESLRLRDVRVEFDAAVGVTTLAAAGTVLSRTSTEYDERGRTLRTTDAAGRTTGYEYDPQGRRVATVDHPVEIDGVEVRHRTETVYDLYGQVAETRTGIAQHADGTLDRSEQTVSESRYDELNRLAEVVNPDDSVRGFAYDAFGRQVGQTDELGRLTAREYDASGRLAAVLLPAVVDPGDLDTTADDEFVTPRYGYGHDARGNLASITDALGRETTLTHDERGNRLTRTLPAGETEAFAYDDRGRVVRHADFAGVVTVTSYDDSAEAGGRAAATTYYRSAADEAAGAVWEAETYGYDAEGRRTGFTRTDGAGTVLREESWSYDDEGRLAAHVTPEGVVSYGYDALGRHVSTATGDPAAPTDRTRYGYDAFGRMETLTVDRRAGADLPAPEVSRYGYDLRGRLDRTDRANGVVTTQTYDDRGWLDVLTHHGPDATPQDLSDNPLLAAFDYDHDASGKRTASAETVARPGGGSDAVDLTWAYDDAGRLTSETLDHSDDALDRETRWTYDPHGNRVQQTRDDGLDGLYDEVARYAFDANDRLLEEALDRDADGAVDRLTAYAYDGDREVGRTATESGAVVWEQSAGYDARGRMAEVETTDYAAGGAVESVRTLGYDYDAGGVRVATAEEVDQYGDGTVEESRLTRFLADHMSSTGYAQTLAETVEDQLAGTSETKTFAYGLDALTQAGPAGTFELLADGHGSTRLLTAPDAAAVQAYLFDAYGNAVGFDPAAALTGLLYSGEFFDAALGRQYLRARWYDAGGGRFGRLDPFFGNTGDPQSLHKYGYVHGDPVGLIDPTGKWGVAQTTAALGIGSVFVNMGIHFAVSYQIGNHLVSKEGIDKAPDGGLFTFGWSYGNRGAQGGLSLTIYWDWKRGAGPEDFYIFVTPEAGLAPISYARKFRGSHGATWGFGVAWNADNPADLGGFTFNAYWPTRLMQSYGHTNKLRTPGWHAALNLDNYMGYMSHFARYLHHQNPNPYRIPWGPPGGVTKPKPGSTVESWSPGSGAVTTAYQSREYSFGTTVSYSFGPYRVSELAAAGFDFLTEDVVSSVDDFIDVLARSTPTGDLI